MSSFFISCNFLRFTYVTKCVSRFLSPLIAEQQFMPGHTSFKKKIDSTVDLRLNCFQFLPVINCSKEVIINNTMCTLFVLIYVFVSFGQTPRSEISGLCNKYVFNFLKKLPSHHFSKVVCCMLPPAMKKHFSFSTFLPIFDIVSCFGYSQSSGCISDITCG